MTLLKSTLAVLGLTFALAACEPVPSSASFETAKAGSKTAAVNSVFETYTPLKLKAMRASEMRQRLAAGGYTKASTERTRDGGTRELWRGTITRGGAVASRTRVRFTTCPGSSIVKHSRTTLDDMTASFGREMVSFVRARPAMVLKDERQNQGGQRMRFILIGTERNLGGGKRGELLNALGGVRIFDNGDRRVGITIHTSCG